MNIFASNPLKTREDVKKAVLDMCSPLLPLYSAGKSRLHIGNTSAGYSDSTAEVEAFARPLWGLAPLFTDGSGEDWAELYRRGLACGTDPESPEYWGDVHDCDQLLVEMAAMGLGLILAPEKLWEPLSEKEKANLYRWLNFVNTKKAWDCNWRLFAVMVNLGFRKVGLPYNTEVVEAALSAVESYYLGDGWYADGINAHSDYYVPFAIYFYGLIYAKEMEEADPERSRLFKERADKFAHDFIYYFSEDGSAVPYGRSMTYRFAQTAFWSAYAYAGVGGFEDGVVKGIILRHLRSWFKRPIWNNDGTLTIGFGYPNLIMTEGYNAPGSPYWSMKSFLILALGESSDFWRSEELPLPKPDKSRTLPHPHMIAQTDGEHRVLFAAGHPYVNCHTHCGAKYEKFAYSNIFGFSVSKSNWGVGAGGFDSTLALSERDNVFRVKHENKGWEVTDKYIHTVWTPWSDVHIDTYIIPSLPWHVRVHIINSGRELEGFEGGFAYPSEHTSAVRRTEGGAFADFDGFTGGIVDLIGGRNAWIQGMEANTNLIWSRTSLPALGGGIEKGRTVLACAVFCGRHGAENIPSVTVSDNKISVNIMGEDVIINI